MSNILLGVIGNGRYELLEQTYASMVENLPMELFGGTLLVDDTGDKDYQNMLWRDFEFDAYMLHKENKGLSGSVRSLWEYALMDGYDYVFHLEEDFLFNEKVDVQEMVDLLESHQALAQIALVRQPVNDDEVAAGGMMNFHYPEAEDLKFMRLPDSCIDVKMMTQRKLFTLNPCLYPRWVVELGWEQGWGEREFSDRLFPISDMIACGYLGHRADPPKVTHTGHYRAQGWFV